MIIKSSRHIVGIVGIGHIAVGRCGIYTSIAAIAICRRHAWKTTAVYDGRRFATWLSRKRFCVVVGSQAVLVDLVGRSSIIRIAGVGGGTISLRVFVQQLRVLLHPTTVDTAPATNVLQLSCCGLLKGRAAAEATALFCYAV